MYVYIFRSIPVPKKKKKKCELNQAQQQSQKVCTKICTIRLFLSTVFYWYFQFLIFALDCYMVFMFCYIDIVSVPWYIVVRVIICECFFWTALFRCVPLLLSVKLKIRITTSIHFIPFTFFFFFSLWSSFTLLKSLRFSIAFFRKNKKKK